MVPATAHPRTHPRYDDPPTILRGTTQVLTAVAETDDLRLRVGRQNDLSTDLLLILSRHNARQRRPVVVLLRTAGVLCAAVIFAERCFLGFGIGLLRAGDQAGDGAVIAAQSERTAALLFAVDALLQDRRCHTVAASLSGAKLNLSDVPPQQGMLMETYDRTVRRLLPLGSTLQDTLHERFSLKKRRNLLYYRRTLWKTHEVEFVPHIPVADAHQAMLQLAHNSWPYRTPREIALHCDFLTRHPEYLCMGIRMKTGIWLSLVTGWRVDGVTHMPWQLNHAAYLDESLMQVMRTCLIEHECERGQIALSWVGGTVAFQTACEQESCLDLLKTRRGLRSALLRHTVAPLLAKRNPNAFTGGSLMLLLTPPRRGSLGNRLDPDS